MNIGTGARLELPPLAWDVQHLQGSVPMNQSILSCLQGLRTVTRLGPGDMLAFRGFPGGAVVKNPPANAGDKGSSPDPGRSHMPRSN